ncbi:UNVERIFIED_CONTAM: hypothetical protein PYX00_006015 [Menopon gallinae]|uniref:AN1-type domain-containing protein n=1 Tax=Menopon gallinae TaxID=328185 RepID=A0AAW2HUY8_9NEOP
MELPHLGEQCSEPTCKKLDFLPVKCDACGNIYCMDHMSYVQHSCPSAHKKDVQVPICPLCGSPVPTPRNQPPDIAVSEHIDRDCQSDPAKAKRKVKANKCALPGCRVKELVPVICSECRQNFCLRHRFPDDHKCVGKKGKVFQKMRLWLKQYLTATSSQSRRRSFRDVRINRNIDHIYMYIRINT